MVDYYDKISDGYDNLYLEEQLKKLDIISKHFKPKPVLLDLGAGTCIANNYFKIETVSVDSSKEMLSRGSGKRIHASAESLPFTRDTFNSLVCLTAFHHFDAGKAIKEIKRVCKSGSPVTITLLKKSSKFNLLRKKLLSSFDVKEYDCINDVAFIGRI